MVFYWIPRKRKSPQVSRKSQNGSFLSILADLNNMVIWMVSIRPPIFNSSSPLSEHLETVPITPLAIGITANFMFHSIFSSLARSKYLSLFSFSLIFTLWSTKTEKSTIWPGSNLVGVTITRSRLLARMK